MRIPLDYYRILGLPIQATAEQLQQAHRDRALQLPRREYSEGAIAARKQLLDEAYSVLSDAEQRRAYDAKFLASAYDTQESGAPKGIRLTDADPTLDPYAPSIDIHDSQLVGALLILLELGEYELVLEQGRGFLARHANHQGYAPQEDANRGDIVLTVALASLELGRERWHQGQYEAAAAALSAGQDLLQREGVVPSIRQEMQADLYKLRPYRILELLSLPEQNQLERRQGLSLLQEMLNDRSGIDGSGNDQSGLHVDDFLRFIQQLRGYLTAAEQQALFEGEAQRPSAVATYLAVYAQLARGFAYRQPALIRRAKHMLMRLSNRQDVHLEQAVCALLLGQTEEANRALELSQEQESISFIRENSRESPDLLPGLCLYSERWLQNEVFPHFRDLAQQQASLKEYFADQQVQAYLEELPSEPEVIRSREQMSAPTLSRGSSADYASNGSTNGTYNRQYNETRDRTDTVNPTSRTATIEPNRPLVPPAAEVGALPTAERVAQLSPEGRLTSNAPQGGNRRPVPPPPLERRNPDGLRLTPSHGSGGASPKLDRLLFLIAVGVLGLSLVFFLLSRIANALFGGPSLQGDQLAISLIEPPVAIPDPATESPAASTDPNAPLSADAARTVVDGWLAAKRASMGEGHDTSRLSTVLADPFLSQRMAAAEDARITGTTQTYRHSLLEVQVLPSTSQNADQAQVKALVVESLDGESERLDVTYQMVRQNGQWRISSIADLQVAPDTGATTAPGNSDSGAGTGADAMTTPSEGEGFANPSGAPSNGIPPTAPGQPTSPDLSEPVGSSPQ
ncbi:IMS domain-containing protein [Leptolyngbya sp. AN02str]|uniref:IMS domain-containing protein n=1 Tax=Leptolyngbya sp. AN02str TaxID=3423363 RepID=UPI003D31E3C8